MTKQLSFVLKDLAGVPDELPERTNCCSWSSEELVAYYIEAEAREANGETRGCTGWPTRSMKRLKGNLRGLRNSLEGSRKKWCMEENAIEAKRKRVSEEIVLRALQK